MATRRRTPQQTEKLFDSLDSKQQAAAEKLLTRFENLLKHATSDAERREVVSEMSEQVAALGKGISELSTQVVSKIADDNNMHLSKSYYYTVPDDGVGSEYQDIIDKYYDNLLKGKTADESLEEAGSSFKQATADSLNHIRNDTIQHASRSVSGATVIGFRRVIHPELAKGGSCGLCIVAATQIYKDKHLKKIHDNCNCSVLPIYRTDDGKRIDPGASMNRKDLGKLYKAAGDSTLREGLKRTRWKRGPDGTLVPQESTLVKPKKGDKVNPGPIKINDQSIVLNQPTPAKEVKADAKKADKLTAEDKAAKVIKSTKSEVEPKAEPKVPAKVTEVKDVPNNDIGGTKSTAIGPKDVEEIIAPDDAPDTYFAEPQAQAAQDLRRAGIDVKSVADKDIAGRQAPDAIVDGMTADIISVPTPSITATVRAARYVTPAAQAVVLDGSQAGLTMETAHESLLRILARYGLRLLAVVIICVDGIIRWLSSSD